MNEIEVFSNEQFGKVRTAANDGQIWFCLTDICKILEIGNAADVRKRLIAGGIDKIEVGVKTGMKRDGTDSIQKIPMIFVNEANLYKAIFQSRKPEAEKFSDWVTGEVLPSIRKTGSYNATKNIPQTFPEALRAYANEVEQRELAEKQRDEAIRTKARIGSKREATAMSTAAAKTKECEMLKIELDKSKECASIRAVEKLTKKKFDWRKLRNYCTSKELEMKKVSDPLYGKINTYPNEAWKKVYGINLEYLF